MALAAAAAAAVTIPSAASRFNEIVAAIKTLVRVLPSDDELAFEHWNSEVERVDFALQQAVEENDLVLREYELLLRVFQRIGTRMHLLYLSLSAI